MSIALTEAKMAIVDTLKADAGIIAEFTAANVDYGEPRNLDLSTTPKRINVISVGEVREDYAVLSRNQSNVKYRFQIVASFLDSDPKSASDRWEQYDGLVKDALDANPFLLRSAVQRASLGIFFTSSEVVNNPSVDHLYHVLVGMEARHRIVAGARA